eukprot:2197423-Amphidinium_carterae.6
MSDQVRISVLLRPQVRSRKCGTPFVGGQPASLAVRPQVRSAQGTRAELAANEETGEILAPDTDMPAAEEGVEERTLAKGHLPSRRWCPQCVSGRGVGQQHRRVAHAEEELPIVHADFAFFSSGVTDESEKITM